MPQSDYVVENHGSIFLVQPLNGHAQHWLEENVEPEAQWLGTALAVEHRYIHDLVAALQDDGFSVR